MCYRENVPLLDFTGIHLAVLAGDNGNGKSAIIDAITWALWGRTRAGSVDNLIHALANDMEVQFDFKVGSNLYRVIRKRARPRKRSGAGQSALELQIWNGDAFRVISGNTIDETQQKIIDTLHMDYETFINSAYLRQGHADEFTRQPPGKRKEVLGAILGLDIYSELEEKARNLARLKEGERQQAEKAIEEMAAELSQRPVFETEYEQAKIVLSEAEKTVQEKEASLGKLRSRLEVMELQQKQLEELDHRLAGNRKLKEDLRTQAEEHRRNVAAYRDVLAKKMEIEAGYADYKAARHESDELSLKLQRSMALERRRTELEKAIEKARQDIIRTLDRYQQEVEKLEERVGLLPELEKQFAGVEKELDLLTAQEKEIEEQRTVLRKAEQDAGLLKAEMSRLEKEIAEAGEKLDLLSRHQEEQTDMRCPLCESELTAEGLELIESKYLREQQEKRARLFEAGKELEKRQADIISLQRELDSREKNLRRQRSALDSRAGSLRKDIDERRAEETRLAKGREYVAAITSQLEKRDYAKMEQEELVAVEKELAALGYDEERHRDAQTKVENLKQWEQQHQKLEEAERLIDREENAAGRAEESAAALQQTLEQEGERRQKLALELESLPELKQQTELAEAEYRKITSERSQAQETAVALHARLEHLDELNTKKKEKESALAELAREAAAYKDLTKAFGKSGIQAFLIDMALPDIENEANRLLTLMTDNRMHINFETQQETKAGTVRETLDIFITDELGTRDYEMFSGGEAFRINLAIRIALSRLLTKRAGAPLPTLIIDEGFGTQDSTGMEKLKEAINSIQGEFEKILVITHVEELKDAFPCRIDVIKTPEGSTFNIN